MSVQTALALLQQPETAHVLFVGDHIVDEYHYVTPLGKSPKEHLISVAYEESEAFRGGVHAAAAHAQTFCASTWIATSPHCIRKVRYVDRTYLRKLFEVHYAEPLVPIALPQDLGPVEMVVVTDFGHGQITPDLIDTLQALPYPLAVNAQTNSANIGYNLITKYARADYVVIDEPEARLAAGNRDGKIEDVMLALLYDRHEGEGYDRYQTLIVTQGSRGAIGCREGLFARTDALTQQVVDTMGAGDAFFAVTAPFHARASLEDLLIIGGAAGAMKTQIVGHRQSVTKDALVRYLCSLA